MMKYLHRIFCLIVLLLFYMPQVFSAEADRKISYPVIAGETDYELPIEIVNKGTETLSSVTVYVQSISPLITNFSKTPDKKLHVLNNQSQQVLLRFDISKEAKDKDIADLFLKVVSSNAEFDRPLINVRLMISANEKAQQDINENEGEGSGTSDEKPEKDDDTLFEPEMAYVVVKVEGTGYSPAYGGMTTVTTGSHEKFVKVKLGEDPIAVVQKYYEDISKGASCSIWKAWAGVTGIGAPMFWGVGPKVTILNKGPYTRTDLRRGGVALASDWKRLPSVKTPTWSDLRKMACSP